MTPRDCPSSPDDVYLFGTCLADLFGPEAGVDAVALLEREGVRVHFPQAQSCCGQPAYTSGNIEAARSLARSQMDLFKQPWPIVVPSGSCAGTMRHHWPLMFEGEPGLARRAQAISERVFELAEFLVRVLAVDYSSASTAPTKVALHTSCSARREMGTRTHGVELLGRLPGVELVEHGCESECCGFGGLFSIKHPDISGAMVADKVKHLRASGCDRVVSADLGCLLNITHAAQFHDQRLDGQHLASFVRSRLEGRKPEGRDR